MRLKIVLKIPESGLAKVRSGTHKPLLLSGATVPDDGGRLHNQQLVAGRLLARGIECGAEDLDYEMVGGSRDNEYAIKVAARLAQDVDDEEEPPAQAGTPRKERVLRRSSRLGTVGTEYGGRSSGQCCGGWCSDIGGGEAVWAVAAGMAAMEAYSNAADATSPTGGAPISQSTLAGSTSAHF